MTDVRARQRRLLLGAIGAGALFGLLGLTPRAPADQRVLAITYDASPDPNVDHLRDNLLMPGVVLTFVRGPSPDQMADLLGQSSFDQVWIWDLSIFQGLTSAADRAALATWFSTHRKVVLDSRSLGLFFDNDVSEMGLSHNIVANLAAAGGGLWVGGKAGESGVRTANAYLGALGFSGFTGELFEASPLTGSANPLLTNPNAIDVQGLRWLSTAGTFARSIAPLGLQPNGLTLETVVSDQLGNPLITTNIPEGHGLIGAGLGAAYVLGRRRRG